MQFLSRKTNKIVKNVIRITYDYNKLFKYFKITRQKRYISCIKSINLDPYGAEDNYNFIGYSYDGNNMYNGVVKIDLYNMIELKQSSFLLIAFMRIVKISVVKIKLDEYYEEDMSYLAELFWNMFKYTNHIDVILLKDKYLKTHECKRSIYDLSSFYKFVECNKVDKITREYNGLFSCMCFECELICKCYDNHIGNCECDYDGEDADYNCICYDNVEHLFVITEKIYYEKKENEKIFNNKAIIKFRRKCDRINCKDNCLKRFENKLKFKNYEIKFIK